MGSVMSALIEPVDGVATLNRTALASIEVDGERRNCARSPAISSGSGGEERATGAVAQVATGAQQLVIRAAAEACKASEPLQELMGQSDESGTACAAIGAGESASCAQAPIITRAQAGGAAEVVGAQEEREKQRLPEQKRANDSSPKTRVSSIVAPLQATSKSTMKTKTKTKTILNRQPANANSKGSSGGTASASLQHALSNANERQQQCTQQNLSQRKQRQRHKPKQQHQQLPKHQQSNGMASRSLSTSSSLASSSSSSSPSSSMIQIITFKQDTSHHQISTKSLPSMSNKYASSHSIRGHQQRARRHHQPPAGCSSSSSSSSTISTCSSSSCSSSPSSSSSSSGQLSGPTDTDSGDDLVAKLIHSAANLTLNQQHHQHLNQHLNNNHHGHQASNFYLGHGLTSAVAGHNNISMRHQHVVNLNQHHQEQPLYAPPTLLHHLLPGPPPPRPWLNSQAGDDYSNWPPKQHQSARAFGDAPKQAGCAPRQYLDSGEEFTVISYNVLCDRMVSNEYFPSSPDIALDWHYRRQLILGQLLEFNADIVALQELEMEQYEAYFRPELERLGHYASMYEPKSRAKTMDFHKRKRVDGCAIFFKNNRFRLVQQHLLEFSQIAMANAQGSEAMLNRVMTKDNIGLAAILEFKDQQQEWHHPHNHPHDKSKSFGQAATSKKLLVCNTHIHWDPECCDVKLIQTIMLMNELKCIASQHNLANIQGAEGILSEQNKYYENLLPLVLLGDFNSLPMSGVTTYLTMGEITSEHKDFKNFKYTSCSNALAMHPANHDYSHCALETNSNTNSLRRQSSPAYSFYSTSPASSGGCASSPPSGSPSPISHLATSKLPGDYSLANNPKITTTTTSSSSSSTTNDATVLNYNHPFKLISAYGRDTMPYTNYTTKFKAIIDYIFYTQNSIQLLGILGPLDKDWLRGNRIRGLPQPHLPSDHLPLLAKLRLLPAPQPPTPAWPSCTTASSRPGRRGKSRGAVKAASQQFISPGYSHSQRTAQMNSSSTGSSKLSATTITTAHQIKYNEVRY